MRLDASLSHRLAALALKLRGYLVMQGVARLAAFLVLAALLQFVLDYGVRGMRWSMRASLLGVLVLLVLVIVWRRILIPLMLRMEAADIARLVERKFPQLSSVLISAVRFSSGQVGSPKTNSPELMSAVVQCAPHAALPLDFSKVLSPRSPRRSVVVLVSALGWMARRPS